MKTGLAVPLIARAAPSSDLQGGYSERSYKLPNLIYLTP